MKRKRRKRTGGGRAGGGKEGGGGRSWGKEGGMRKAELLFSRPAGHVLLVTNIKCIYGNDNPIGGFQLEMVRCWKP